MKNTFSRFEVNPAAGMLPSSFTPPGAFTTGDKTEVNHFYHSSDDESILAGVWECAPGKASVRSIPSERNDDDIIGFGHIDQYRSWQF